MSEDLYKIGYFNDKGFVALVTDVDRQYAHGWADGYNLHADTDVIVLSQVGCQCGPLRRTITKPPDDVLEGRTGCLRCGTWDAPPRARR